MTVAKGRKQSAFSILEPPAVEAPALSPEREALALAIREREKDVKTIAAIERAIEESYAAGGSADDRVEAARSKVRELDHNRNAALVAQALGGPNVATEKAAAVAALAAAESDLKNALDTTAALREALKDNKSHLDWMERNVGEAVRAVLKSESGALLAEFARLKAEFVPILNIVETLIYPLGVLPNGAADFRNMDTSRQMAPWLLVTRQLSEDASAPMPIVASPSI